MGQSRRGMGEHLANCGFVVDGNDFNLLCRASGSVIPKAMWYAVPSSGLAILLHWIFEENGGQMGAIAQSSQIWSSFNFVLGVLIVFRTNQAYSRYWEGATLLQQVRGEWFNAISSLMAFCSGKEEKQTEVEQFQHLVVRLMSMLYCAGMQQVALVSDEKMEIIDNDGIELESLSFLSESADRCEILMQWVQRLIVEAMDSGVVAVPPPILSRVFQELSRGIVNIHNVRKIAEIPFPFPYTQMIMAMLLLQTLLTPVLAAVTSERGWWAGLLTFITILAFWSMNYIAAEIEQPFGEDTNDLPIPEMLRDMNRSLRTILLQKAQAPPKFSYERELHSDCETIPCTEANFCTSKRVVQGFTKSRTRTIKRIRTQTAHPVAMRCSSFEPLSYSEGQFGVKPVGTDAGRSGRRRGTARVKFNVQGPSTSEASSALSFGPVTSGRSTNSNRTGTPAQPQSASAALAAALRAPKAGGADPTAAAAGETSGPAAASACRTAAGQHPTEASAESSPRGSPRSSPQSSPAQATSRAHGGDQATDAELGALSAAIADAVLSQAEADGAGPPAGAAVGGQDELGEQADLEDFGKPRSSLAWRGARV